MAALKAVADADEWPGHLIAEVVNHKEQIPRMIHPRTVVAQLVFVENAAQAEIGLVSCPDPADGISV